MLNVNVLLVLAAFVCTIANALGKCPAWVPLFLLVMIHLLAVVPR